MASEASKTILLERREERTLVREGKSVLEDRRDLLAHMLVDQLEICENTLNKTHELWVEGRDLLRAAVIRHGRFGIDNFATNEPQIEAVGWKVRNRLGTPWLVTDNIEIPLESATPEDDLESSVELEAARQILKQLLASLVTLAMAQNNLTRLTEVYRRTQRRVNALEHIILPELNQSIKNIEDRMDEMERDDLVRTLLIKRRQL